MSTKSKSYFSPGMLAMKLAKAIEANGGTPEEINAIAEDDKFIRLMLSVRRGANKIVSVFREEPVHIIDCDANPFCPAGLKVEQHFKGGKIEWNKENQAKALWLSAKQENGNCSTGEEIQFDLVSTFPLKTILNANVLDYLLANPEFIPEEWERKNIFFWGTIYRHPVSGLGLRCLRWSGSEWYWLYFWLGAGFDSGSPAALRAI